MVNLRLYGHFENIDLEVFRKPDRHRIDGLVTYFNNLGLFPYLRYDEIEEINPQYEEIELGVIFDTKTEDQRNLLRRIRNSNGNKLTLRGHSFRTHFRESDRNNECGIGTALLVPVRTFVEQIPLVKKPANIELFLASPQGIDESIRLMDLNA